VNCPLARLITGEHLQRGKLQNNISLEVKIKMGSHRLKCPWTKILQNQYPNSAVCRPQKTTDRFCLSRGNGCLYTMAMVQIYRPPMWVWKVGIPLNGNIYIKRNNTWDLTMDIWGILFQTNPLCSCTILQSGQRNLTFNFIWRYRRCPTRLPVQLRRTRH
jgi:hypothetical protein